MNYLLGKGELLLLDSRCLIEAITVRRGRIWLTRRDDPADYCLEQGALIRLGSVGGIAIEAFEECEFSVIWREAPATLTVTLRWPRHSLAK